MDDTVRLGSANGDMIRRRLCVLRLLQPTYSFKELRGSSYREEQDYATCIALWLSVTTLLVIF